MIWCSVVHALRVIIHQYAMADTIRLEPSQDRGRSHTRAVPSQSSPRAGRLNAPVSVSLCIVGVAWLFVTPLSLHSFSSFHALLALHGYW